MSRKFINLSNWGGRGVTISLLNAQVECLCLDWEVQSHGLKTLNQVNGAAFQGNPRKQDKIMNT